MNQWTMVHMLLMRLKKLENLFIKH
jgi:hypothetical protein